MGTGRTLGSRQGSTSGSAGSSGGSCGAALAASQSTSCSSRGRGMDHRPGALAPGRRTGSCRSRRSPSDRGPCGRRSAAGSSLGIPPGSQRISISAALRSPGLPRRRPGPLELKRSVSIPSLPPVTLNPPSGRADRPGAWREAASWRGLAVLRQGTSGPTPCSRLAGKTHSRRSHAQAPPGRWRTAPGS